jgi:hypothetical protein
MQTPRGRLFAAALVACAACTGSGHDVPTQHRPAPVVDSDCASGYCSPSVGSLGTFYGIQGYYCHTPKDTCSNDSDCGGGGYCA